MTAVGRYIVRNDRGEELVIETSADRISLESETPWTGTASNFEDLRLKLAVAIGDLGDRR